MIDALPKLVKVEHGGCISLKGLVPNSCTKVEWLSCSGCALLHHDAAFSSALSHIRAVASQRLVMSKLGMLLLLLCSCFCCMTKLLLS